MQTRRYLALSTLTFLLAAFLASTGSGFPDSNSEFSLNESEEKFFYGENVEYGDSRFVVYGPYQVKDRDYTVVRNAETGEERVYTNGSRLGPIDRLQGKGEKVQGVRNLYLKTRLDPLLYSAHSEDLEPWKFEGYGRKLMVSDWHDYTTWEERNLMYREGLKGNNLLAQRFLGNLTKVRDRTQRFYAEPSYRNGKELIDSYETARKGYKDDLESLVNIFDNLASMRSSGSRETWITQSGSTISLSTIFGDLEKINQNSKAIETDIDKRKKILEGEKTVKLKLSATPELKDVDRIERYYSDGDLVDVYRERLDVSSKLVTENGDLQGPYDVKVECLREDHLVSRANHPRSYPSKMITDGVARRINYTDRPYYDEGYPNVRDEGTGQQFSPEGFNQSGKLLDSDLVFTYCPCPYYDRTSLYWQIVHKTRKELEKPLLRDLSLEEVSQDVEGYRHRDELMTNLKKAKVAEKLFMEYPSQTQAERLGKYYRQIYIHSYRSSRNGYSSPELEKRGPRMQRLASLINGKVGAIQRPLEKNYLTDNGARGFMYTESIDVENINRTNFNRVFDEMDVLRHSVARLTFLPDSRSVWRTDEELDYYTGEERLPLWTVYEPNRTE